VKKNYIALGGLFACLHVLFLLVGKFFVGSELLLVLFLPLLSTLYTIKCDRKSVVMFIIATLLICFVFDFVNTFIYIIPSLICGIMYGIFRKNKFKELELLCVSGLVHMVSIAFSFSVIVFLFKEVDFLLVFEKIFSLSGKKLFVVTLLTLFVLGFCEAFLVHVITDNELDKFMGKVEKNDCVPKWFLIPASLSFISFLILSFISDVYGVFAMVVFFVFFIPYIVEGAMNFRYKSTTTFLIACFCFISFFLLNYIDSIYYLILPVFSVSPLVINNFEYKK